MKDYAPKRLWIDDNDIEKMTTRGVVSAYEGAYRADPEYSTQYIRADIKDRLLAGSDGVGGDWTVTELGELFDGY